MKMILVSGDKRPKKASIFNPKGPNQKIYSHKVKALLLAFLLIYIFINLSFTHNDIFKAFLSLLDSSKAKISIHDKLNYLKKIKIDNINNNNDSYNYNNINSYLEKNLVIFSLLIIILKIIKGLYFPTKRREENNYKMEGTKNQIDSNKKNFLKE